MARRPVTYVAVELVGHALFANVVEGNVHDAVDFVVLLALQLALVARRLTSGADYAGSCRVERRLSVTHLHRHARLQEDGGPHCRARDGGNHA